MLWFVMLMEKIVCEKSMKDQKYAIQITPVTASNTKTRQITSKLAITKTA